jgi:DNA-binding transcriptional LysR family regulator
VALLKSFSKASKALFLSQPTITKHISELEQSLAAKLLVRDKAAIELTEIGVVFLVYANQLCAIHNAAQDAVSKIKKGKTNTIRIALSGPDCHWLLPMLNKFKKYSPDVEIHLSILWGKETIEKVLDREINFGLIRSDSAFFAHPLLETVLVEEDEAILVFSPTHRFASMEEIPITDLSREPYLAYGKGTTFWNNQLLKMFHKFGVEPQIYVEATDYHVVKLLVRASWGISFLSRPCVEEELLNGVIKTAPVQDCPPIKRYSILVYRKDMPTTTFSQNLLNMFASNFKRQP